MEKGSICKREDWKMRLRVVSGVTLLIMSVFVRTRSPSQYEISIQTLNSQPHTHKHCN